MAHILNETSKMEMENKNVIEAVPIAPGTQSVEITAPSNLPGGYVLPVDIGGQLCSITVPEGGVTQGQVFTAEYTARAIDSKGNSLEIPFGHWRDGLCDCCSYGCCHPMLCNSYFCELVAISQVMTRLNLNPFAEHGDATHTFKVAIIITASFAIFNFIMNMIAPTGALPAGLFWLFYIVSNAVWIYFMVVVIKTRMHIRHRYRIPIVCCGCLEDCLCAFLCSCCVISQMGRHTTNYGTYRAYCCTKTGVDPTAPSLDDIEEQSPSEDQKLV